MFNISVLNLRNFSIKSLMVFVLMTAVVLLEQNTAEAKKLRLSDDELSKEAVMPVFDEKIVIKNRRVTHKNKVEIGLFGGNVLSEAIFDPLTFGASVAYHFDNTHGLFLTFGLYQDKLSANGERLKNGEVIDTSGNTGRFFDASRAPQKEFMLAGHYQYTAYYGKVSLSKETVMNLSLYGLLGGGAYLMEGLVAPMINFGVGQRFYFTKNIAFRLDLLLSSFYGPDITSTSTVEDDDLDDDPALGLPEVAPDAFAKKLLFDTQINLGITFLL